MKRWRRLVVFKLNQFQLKGNRLNTESGDFYSPQKLIKSCIISVKTKVLKVKQQLDC